MPNNVVIPDAIAKAADKLQIPYDKIEIVTPFLGEKKHQGIASRLLYEDLGFTLQTDGLSGLDERVVLGMVEHNACHCYNLWNKLYSQDLVVPVVDVPFIFINLYNAYTSYFSAQLQHHTFEQQNLDAYHLWRTKQSRDLVRSSDDIPLLFEDAMRGLFAKSCEVPRFVKDMCLPLSLIFEKIKEEGKSWIQRSELLYAVAISMNVFLNLEYSQRLGFMVVTNEPAREVPKTLAKYDIINKDNLGPAEGLVGFLIDKYTAMLVGRKPKTVCQN